MENGERTLADLGELRIIDEIILPLARMYNGGAELGDDCTYLQVDQGLMAVTADVGPRPLIASLPGFENDYEAAGWLSVVACTSDIATAGAMPLFVSNCIDAPPSLSVDALEKFVKGYFKASSEFGFRNGGGDIRHGEKFSIRVFAAGACIHGRKIRRAGGRPGDILAVVGPTGQMIAHYLYCREQIRLESKFRIDENRLSVLRHPRPQIKQMIQLAETGAIRCSSDTSDGLLGAIDNILRASRCGAMLRLSDEMLPQDVVEASQLTGINPWNIAFCWGDWAVVVAIDPRLSDSFNRACSEGHVKSLILGELSDESGLSVQYGGKRLQANILRNENFRSFGYNAGLDGHLRYMLTSKIF